MKKKHFAVIGAGAGGLCAAKNLLAKGIEVTIFETGSKIGGLWVYDNDSGRSPAYRSLHINSEARVSSYIDFPFPAGTPLYPDTVQMEQYFNEYADHFDLRRRIRFKSEVVAIEQDGEGVRVRLRSGESERFDGIVIASGHQSIPRERPSEIDGFTGDYIHSGAYRIPETYTGKRVLVIGPGNSGVDIAADVCTVTDMTYLVARNPVLIMPRLMFGVPQSRILVKVEKPWLPWSLRVKLRILLTRIFHGRMEQWGFRTPTGRTHPISHPTLISHIAWERIKAKPGIDRVNGKTVHFVDGTTAEVDAMIGAIGYHTDLPFMPAGADPIGEGRVDLYNRIVHPELSNVFFVGLFDASGGSNIRMMDDQSEYVASIASGEVKLPEKAEMRRRIDEDLAYQQKQYPHTHRYMLELDPVRYRKNLARDYTVSGVRRTPAAALTERPSRPDYATPGE
ncbi:MAG: NAD(P)-binding domain-containing protein [Rhodobiaceae bacterium]|nr:NAD(P)-binding domain-containing protein [Rhodobiaceae bacterium]MCC0056228.1 NAD(P)-binding domain-containing protein [Rhodobiaceae bacterium]